MAINHREPRGKKERCCSYLIRGNVGKCNSETKTIWGHQIHRRRPLNQGVPWTGQRDTNPNISAEKATLAGCLQNYPDGCMLLPPLIRVENWDVFDCLSLQQTQNLFHHCFPDQGIWRFSPLFASLYLNLLMVIWFNHKNELGRDCGLLSNSSHRWRTWAPHPAANCHLPSPDCGLPGDRLAWPS